MEEGRNGGELQLSYAVGACETQQQRFFVLVDYEVESVFY